MRGRYGIIDKSDYKQSFEIAAGSYVTWRLISLKVWTPMLQSCIFQRKQFRVSPAQQNFEEATIERNGVQSNTFGK